jgi:hypothetical protein
LCGELISVTRTLHRSLQDCIGRPKSAAHRPAPVPRVPRDGRRGNEPGRLRGTVPKGPGEEQEDQPIQGVLARLAAGARKGSSPDGRCELDGPAAKLKGQGAEAAGD